MQLPVLVRHCFSTLEHEELTLEQKDTVSDLSMSWDLPAVTKTNRRWLHNKLLLHAVNFWGNPSYILHIL
uniref:Uncharacterized protein n=1 Tax=Esox lucius TaxID=8010 RepID=A0AAY5KN40_ESOLU